MALFLLDHAAGIGSDDLDPLQAFVDLVINTNFTPDCGAGPQNVDTLAIAGCRTSCLKTAPHSRTTGQRWRPPAAVFPGRA